MQAPTSTDEEEHRSVRAQCQRLFAGMGLRRNRAGSGDGDGDGEKRGEPIVLAMPIRLRRVRLYVRVKKEEPGEVKACGCEAKWFRFTVQALRRKGYR